MKVIAHGPTLHTPYGQQPTIHVSLTLIEFNFLVHGLRSYTELGARNVTSAQNGCDDRTMAATPVNCPHAQAPDPRPEIGMEFTLKAEHLSDTLDALNHATRILRTFTVLAPPPKAEPVGNEFVFEEGKGTADEQNAKLIAALDDPYHGMTPKQLRQLRLYAKNRASQPRPLAGLHKGTRKYIAVAEAVAKRKRRGR